MLVDLYSMGPFLDETTKKPSIHSEVYDEGDVPPLTKLLAPPGTRVRQVSWNFESTLTNMWYETDDTTTYPAGFYWNTLWRNSSFSALDSFPAFRAPEATPTEDD